MLITFEGVEGSGKSTQIKLLSDFFKKEYKLDCIITKEPGGTEIGTKIRNILLDVKNKKLSYLSELLLYYADRSQHLKEIIIPNLQNKKIIFCDRFVDSTIAYQSFARGIDISTINQLNKLVLSNIRISKTILLDLPVETALKRANLDINNGKRDKKNIRFEKESLSFHQKVREGYLKIAEKQKDRFFIIDARQEERKIFEKLSNMLLSFF